uniref:Uncharacterized protein n=1 Tax=Avena sativa TaxID=4498 RepID=A0ACD5U9T7_AVESA
MSRMGSGGKVASWLWRAPRRALGRARDFYVRSLTSCAGQFPGDAAFGYPSFPATPMSCSRSDDYCYSYSASPSSSSRSFGADGDLRELIRAASERRAAPERELPPAVARSRSVAMAKIDEDRPCDFGLAAGAAGVAFGRSRSCAVSAGGHRGRPTPVPLA